MKYFIDTEFIEGFHKPLFGKKRHFIDLISIAIVGNDGRHSYYAVSNEYNYNDADYWVKENVIMPLYKDSVSGDARNRLAINNFHKQVGKSNSIIVDDLRLLFSCWRDQHFWRAPEGIEIYGYYCDYDWVLFCSLFGRMIDLPKGFPMYCRDLKQMLDEKVMSKSFEEKNTIVVDEPLSERLNYVKLSPSYPKQNDEHNALADAKWNYELFEFINKL